MKPIDTFRDFLEHAADAPADVSSSDVIAAYKVRNQILRLPEWRRIS